MAKRKTAAKAETPSFEEAIARLEQIVRELEEADLPLERSLAVFEEGVRLARLLHEKLNEAERKVEILVKDEEGATSVAPFRPAGAPAEGGGEAVDEADHDAEADDGDDDDAGTDDESSQRGLF